MTETFVLANIKCGGCANTIKKELEKLVSASEVTVNFEAGIVEINTSASINRATVLKKLNSLGYPEADENNLFLKAKSFASCMVGRVGA